MITSNELFISGAYLCAVIQQEDEEEDKKGKPAWLKESLGTCETKGKPRLHHVGCKTIPTPMSPVSMHCKLDDSYFAPTWGL